MLTQFTRFISAPFRWFASGFAGRTSWEFLELIIIPLVLALGAFYLDIQSESRQERIAAERYKQETKIADDRSKQEALISYLDQMQELLLERQLRKSSGDSEVRSVARAITTTTIQNLDSERNALLISFLKESILVEIDQRQLNNSRTLRNEKIRVPTILLLSGVTLSQAELNDADLSFVFLSSANLSGANLRNANLRYAFLDYVDPWPRYV